MSWDGVTLKIYVKCSDRFTCAIADQDGNEIIEQDDGYVPSFMPGQHCGDYIILNIDIDTGMVTNWTKPTQEEIETFIARAD